MACFEEIDVEQAKKMMASQEVVIVDIRDPQSYEEAHIPQAIRIDQSNIQEFLQKKDKDKPLICYCYHGFSSQNAAEYFHHNGFQKVYSIVGGFEAWRSS